MELQVTTDDTGTKVLCIYVRLQLGEVYRTAEVVEGGCYVDEDVNGSPLGVEILAPEHMRAHMDKVAETYKRPDLPKVMESLGFTRAA